MALVVQTRASEIAGMKAAAVTRPASS
jgi:hypothetical protein